jgi:hypothetical protein
MGAWYGPFPYGDDPHNQFWIKQGIDYAKNTAIKRLHYTLTGVLLLLVAIMPVISFTANGVR